MKVTLIRHDELSCIDHSIGLCYAKGDYTDTEKRDNRIKKVALKAKHESVLEFLHYTFDIEASTKVLLEMSRHRVASYACKSSRFTLNKGEVIFESTGNKYVDEQLEYWKGIIEGCIALHINNDVVSLMLPQAYQYKWTCCFNARSLKNFLSLRRAPSAHYHIREVSEAMFEAIPDEQKFLFEDEQ